MYKRIKRIYYAVDLSSVINFALIFVESLYDLSLLVSLRHRIYLRVAKEIVNAQDFKWHTLKWKCGRICGHACMTVRQTRQQVYTCVRIPYDIAVH